MSVIRRRVTPLIALALAACASQTSMRTVPASAADEAAIRAVLDTTAAGWNRGELPVYLSAYIPSATAMGSTGLMRGVDAIGDQMRAGYWKAGRPAQVLRYDHFEARPLGPDHALVTGQYILSSAGRPDRTGWFTTIWVRTPAGWRMEHDHSS